MADIPMTLMPDGASSTLICTTAPLDRSASTTCSGIMPKPNPARRNPCLAWRLQRRHILEDSTPAAGASVPTGPLDLQFRYNSRIDRARSRLTLARPDHSRDTIPIIPDGAPDVIRCHLDLTPGDYVVRWQVLAVDGHITRGEVRFVVKGP